MFDCITALYIYRLSDCQDFVLKIVYDTITIGGLLLLCGAAAGCRFFYGLIFARIVPIIKLSANEGVRMKE